MSEGEAALTAPRKLPFPLLPERTFGLGTLTQLVPFQCTTSVRYPALGLNHHPTAHALDGDGAVTASSGANMPTPMLPGSGLFTLAHAAPFQCMIRLNWHSQVE